MYESLSYLPELLTGQSFASYVQDNLFDPLNMTVSTYSVSQAEGSGNMARGFLHDMADPAVGNDGVKKATIPFLLDQGGQDIWEGAAGVLTSARDLVSLFFPLVHLVDIVAHDYPVEMAANADE
jgi:CubicO group peptidase (beta-lactamase class C family)